MRRLHDNFIVRALVVAAFLPLLGGCLGKPGPAEEYLRVSASPAGCAENSNDSSRASVAVGRIRAKEALDRQAVLLASGRVLNPSARWYWEASPGRLLEEALVGALNCQTGLVAVWPARASTDATLNLTGSIIDFEVQQPSMTLVAAAEIQAWNGDGTRLIASRRIAAKVPVTAISAQAIAEAGSKALSGMAADAAGWVAGLAGKGARK